MFWIRYHLNFYMWELVVDSEHLIIIRLTWYLDMDTHTPTTVSLLEYYWIGYLLQQLFKFYIYVYSHVWLMDFFFLTDKMNSAIEKFFYQTNSVSIVIFMLIALKMENVRRYQYFFIYFSIECLLMNVVVVISKLQTLRKYNAFCLIVPLDFINMLLITLYLARPLGPCQFLTIL